ncbi:hypothetical protein HETIRDRAFT_331665 [Heterobasidion irregulare TC 32-1]|uniref:Uncharacterized protein n=1 Tax=Heterobasidion irregulare (strain TC 32-1) TaxID=747525 RepID=W4JNX3_HETIT|nr:uncharacterized protein HETIRDRAFT_331665 [Heterobasidion irregulare TC 32-1]ETW75243.1 hypothetical protein HETIRDRAFT_331665 [Heterobasidion irregulare TC 32-1]
MAPPLPSSGAGHARSAGPPLAWDNGRAQPKRMFSRQSSRAPSPTSSAWSHHAPSQSNLSLAHYRDDGPPARGGAAAAGVAFRSPLFRLRRAPLLRVFVPSPGGEWLSDASVQECEMELRKAGVVALLRPGDVVWDMAVGDEGNTGRLVWDGRFLIDLDYTYSDMGDLPPYLPSLAFPPSYFHRLIRTAGDHKNPICHIDVAPWGTEIAANLQLLQDRVKTETPQGSFHTVIRWVHRSSFEIRSQHRAAPMLVLPTKERLPIDLGWNGKVVVEAEGTNEGLADLQGRCWGAFPPRTGAGAELVKKSERERCVWRILRERSRPGEIWIRAVGYKERLIV